ncbi:TPA: hypothetical protein ACLG1D_001069 [Pseudomonas aeruginosa]
MRKPAERVESSDWGYLIDSAGRRIDVSAEDAYYRRLLCEVKDLPAPTFICCSCKRPAHPRSSSCSISFAHNKGMAEGCGIASKSSYHLSPQDLEKAKRVKLAFFSERHLLETFFVMKNLCGVFHEGTKRLPPSEFEKAILAIASSEPWLWKGVDKYKISMRAVSGIIIKPNDKHTIMWQMKNGRSTRLVKCISVDGLRYFAHKEGSRVSISINGFMSHNKVLDNHPDLIQAEAVCRALVGRFNSPDKIFDASNESYSSIRDFV